MLLKPSFTTCIFFQFNVVLFGIKTFQCVILKERYYISYNIIGKILGLGFQKSRPMHTLGIQRSEILRHYHRNRNDARKKRTSKDKLTHQGKLQDNTCRKANKFSTNKIIKGLLLQRDCRVDTSYRRGWIDHIKSNNYNAKLHSPRN